MDFQQKAKFLVTQFINERAFNTYSQSRVSEDQVYVVWFSKTLQNWKALVSTMIPNGMYYEVTYNGDKKETYIDSYEKLENVVVPDPT